MATQQDPTSSSAASIDTTLSIASPNATPADAADDGQHASLAAAAAEAARVKGPWSPEEDVILSQLVAKFGARNWSMIARGIPGRSGKSCRLRWCNQLDPALKRKPFTGNGDTQ